MSWEQAAQAQDRIPTDMYGLVTPTVHDFLRDRAVTPHEWEVLVEHFGWSGHDKACSWVAAHSTDAGRYDAYSSERELARRSA